jgi:hypothetical protein
MPATRGTDTVANEGAFLPQARRAVSHWARRTRTVELAMETRTILLAVLLSGCTSADSASNADAAFPEPRLWTPHALSTPLYEATPAFSPDGRELFYMQADRAFSEYRLRETRCVDGTWTFPREPDFAAPTGMHDADPFVTPDGDRLLFVSTRHRFHEVGNEDFDIFEVARLPEGGWGAPRRLPPPVNSPASELLPRMDRQGVLYFGSSRPGGAGGSDIYRATVRNDVWTVENLEAVNSTANEYEADVSADGRRLAVVTDRELRSRIHVYRHDRGTWRHEGRVHGREEVFQVGPRFSPDGGRLLFAQDAGERSGELFVVDLAEGSHHSWPPSCAEAQPPGTASEPAPH